MRIWCSYDALATRAVVAEINWLSTFVLAATKRRQLEEWTAQELVLSEEGLNQLLDWKWFFILLIDAHRP
jgi:hypothetical protein